MDPTVVDALRSAGIDPDLARLVPSVGIEVDEHGEILPVADDVVLLGGERKKRSADVRLRKVSELWTGDAVPPDFPREPTAEYQFFFGTIERTAADACAQAVRV